MALFSENQITVDTTGSAGSATGSGESDDPIDGGLWSIHINYHASAPATTVVTITEVDGAARTLFTAPAGNTDIEYYPRGQLCDDAGVDQGVSAVIAIPNRKISVDVSASDALTGAVVVTLIYLGEIR